MRRSLALTAIALSALPLLACSAGGAKDAQKDTSAVATPSVNAPVGVNLHPGRSTASDTIAAYTKALTAHQEITAFAFNCVQDQTALLLTNDVSSWSTGATNGPSSVATFKVEAQAITKEHVVPLVITTIMKAEPDKFLTTRRSLILENGLWCVSGSGAVSREGSDKTRTELRDNVAHLLVNWTAKHPTLAVPPAVMDAQKKSATFQIDGTTEYPVALGQGTRVVLTSTAPTAAGTGSYCFSVTNIGATNPEKALVFNSTKGGNQPAGATC